MKKQSRITKLASRYMHLDMIQPATPRVIALIKTIRLSGTEGEVAEPPAEVGDLGAVAFVEHWVSHGWTIPKLVKAYASMRRTALLYLGMIAVAVAVIGGHIASSYTLQPILTATSILAVAMLAISYMNLAMLCWRIRTQTLDARIWLRLIFQRQFREALGIPGLPRNYVAALKAQYDVEKAGAIPPTSA